MAEALKKILKDDKKFNEIAKIAFDSVDEDKSGEIDSKELEKLMIQMAEDMGTAMPTKEEVLEVFNSIDQDGSGKIDADEFKQLIKEVLEEFLN